MRVFAQTERDRENDVLRVEFTGEDLDLLEGVHDRLRVLLNIEAAMDSVAVESPFILGQDIPHCTADGIKLLNDLLELDTVLVEVG